MKNKKEFVCVILVVIPCKYETQERKDAEFFYISWYEGVVYGYNRANLQSLVAAYTLITATKPG